MKHIKLFEEYLNENISDGVYWRLVGGGQFGGAAITRNNEPKRGDTVSSAFATPNIKSISAMIDYCLEEGENEETGKPIKITDMRVLKIKTSKARTPNPWEKVMNWDESDEGEVFIEKGKVIEVITAKDFVDAIYG